MRSYDSGVHIRGAGGAGTRTHRCTCEAIAGGQQTAGPIELPSQIRARGTKHLKPKPSLDHIYTHAQALLQHGAEAQLVLVSDIITEEGVPAVVARAIRVTADVGHYRRRSGVDGLERSRAE